MPRHIIDKESLTRLHLYNKYYDIFESLKGFADKLYKRKEESQDAAIDYNTKVLYTRSQR